MLRPALSATISVALLLLTGCGWMSRDLRDPQTGKVETCTFGMVVGDPMPLPPDHPYCKCISDHLAAGYVAVGSPKLAMCRALGADQ